MNSDNGSELINLRLKEGYEQQIQLTRGLALQKDENAHIEQKNWTYVSKLLDWNRYESPAAVEAINRSLWRQELRLMDEPALYLPSVKRAKKVHLASKLRRVTPPGTEERAVASGQAGWSVREVRRLCSSWIHLN